MHAAVQTKHGFNAFRYDDERGADEYAAPEDGEETRVVR
jgi:hypothetical protein